MGFEKFFQMVTARNMGEGQRQRLLSIQEAARNSIGCEVDESIAFEAKLLVDHLIRVREMITETDARIEAACRRVPGYESIRSMPGFGPVIVAAVMTALGDPHRFTSSKQVLKLAGLDLSRAAAARTRKKLAQRYQRRARRR
jgi:transposase